jgi:hypothetical protein
MGMVVLLAMLVVNSPLLNFQSIAADSQIARITSPIIGKEDFDHNYFKHNLGRQGYLAVTELQSQNRQFTPELIAIIDRMYFNIRHRQNKSLKNSKSKKLLFLERTTFWPSQAEFDDALVDAIYVAATKHYWQNIETHNYYVVSVDLNSDGEQEVIFVKENNNLTSSDLWYLEDKEWKSRYVRTENPSEMRSIKQLIKNNKVKVEEPKWQLLKIGNLTFQIPEGRN